MIIAIIIKVDEMTKTVTLEGFLDYGTEDAGDMIAIVVKPVMVQYDDASSGIVQNIVEDYAIDHTTGTPWDDDPWLDRRHVMNTFYRVRKKGTERFEYWNRVIELDDKEEGWVYKTLDGVGDMYEVDRDGK